MTQVSTDEPDGARGSLRRMYRLFRGCHGPHEEFCFFRCVRDSAHSLPSKSELEEGKIADASLAGPEKDGFTFDRVFDTATQQNEIFDWGVKGIVDGESGVQQLETHIGGDAGADEADVMMGFNGTLFCYGQTGSGKTYSALQSQL